jgi:hypothetical protein
VDWPAGTATFESFKNIGVPTTLGRFVTPTSGILQHRLATFSCFVVNNLEVPVHKAAELTIARRQSVGRSGLLRPVTSTLLWKHL